MIRVLQVGKYYPPVDGGIENNVHALCAGLASRYDVTALVFNTEARTVRETAGGVRIVRVATLGKVFSTEMAPSFFPWFMRLRDADVIHLHTPNPIAELACLAAPARARLIVTYHSDVVRQKLLGQANRLVLRRLMHRADRVIVYTRRYMETSPVASAFAGKTACIPHGVDLDEFAMGPAVLQRARGLREEHGGRLILFVGRLVYYKGVDVLLRALRRLPDARLLVAGDGPMKGPLISLARELGVADRTSFLGGVSHQEKLACYEACDVLALPATHRSEAFGQVQIEAMACRRPVVSTEIDSGVPFVNRHGVTGLVVSPFDDAALAEALGRLLDDAALRQRLGLAGRQRVEELFSRPVMLRDTLELYEEVLGERAGARVPQGAET